MTRALFVAPSGRFRGGVERHVHDLAVGLRERGHEITLAVPEGAPCDDAFVAPFTRVEPRADLSKAARDVDVVYAHKPIVAGALVAAARVAPVFVAVHDHDLTCVRSHRYLPVSLEPCHRPPGVACVTHGCCVVRSAGPLKISLKSPFALRADLLRLADAARFVAASQYLADRLTDAGVAAARVDVIHPATRDEPSAAAPVPEARALLFVGQVVRGKGLDLLLRALPGLVGDLVVAGDGSGRAEAEALAKELGVAARVRFLGAVAPAAMPALYDAARVVVVPSRWPEPFGMVGVEAMRRGRLVVAARHGGIPEWLVEGRAGHGFHPGDVADLADAVRRALDAPDYAARAAAGAEVAASRLSFAHMVTEVERRVLGVRG
ncbi:MAG TPA: glycosyltransferase family 4 protein [Byssovorax sp.]